VQAVLPNNSGGQGRGLCKRWKEAGNDCSIDFTNGQAGGPERGGDPDQCQDQDAAPDEEEVSFRREPAVFLLEMPDFPSLCSLVQDISPLALAGIDKDQPVRQRGLQSLVP